jgi:hypothetical protein
VTEDPPAQEKGKVPSGPPEQSQELIQAILTGVISGAELQAWRLGMRMTPGNLGRVLHFSRRHIIRLEHGGHITEHFMVRLRSFVVGLPDPLPLVPPGIPQRPRPPNGRAEVWVPLTKVTGRGEWRACAGCHETFYFTDKRKLYHSRKCKDAAEARGESVGVVSGKRPDYAPRRFRCPGCGQVHPLAGNMVKEERSAVRTD